MNDVIIVGTGSDMLHVFPRHCDVVVAEPRERKYYIEIPDAQTELQEAAQLLSVSYAELVDAVRNLGNSTFIASEELAAICMKLGEYCEQRDYETFQSKHICTKPFKSKIKKSQYAASTYQRSGFQATRKLARGRI